jgi:dTDP-4-amino-4,6-dideoxygalactose transaminase
MLKKAILTSDPRAEYHALKHEIDAAMRSVLEGPSYVLGEAVSNFETRFAQFIGCAHGIGVNNGTDSIHLALRALGVCEGDEVITVSHTAVATVAAIGMSGATPVLVDVDPLERTIDPTAAEKMVNERTKAIVVVHLYGQPADMDALMELCDRRGLHLVEDCAQSHAATYRGKRTGSFGVVSTFSFYPTKNLGAIGDGGMILTNDDGIADRCRLLRQYGWQRPQFSVIPGWNSRLDPLQAAILSVKLSHLPDRTRRRQELASRYHDRLKDLPLKLPTEFPDREHVYHLYVVELQNEKDRDRLREHLATENIHAGIHYQFAVHEQPAYTKVIHAELPVTEQLARTVLSLPLYPDLSNEEQDQVIRSMRNFFS